MSNEESLSLCCSCRNASDCMLRKEGSPPSFYCEQFEIEPLPATERLRKETTSSVPVEGFEADCADTARNSGLCSDCRNKKNCCLNSRDEGGVWHCEEYE